MDGRVPPPHPPPPRGWALQKVAGRKVAKYDRQQQQQKGAAAGAGGEGGGGRIVSGILKHPLAKKSNISFVCLFFVSFLTLFDYFDCIFLYFLYFFFFFWVVLITFWQLNTRGRGRQCHFSCKCQMGNNFSIISPTALETEQIVGYLSVIYVIRYFYS